MSFLKLTTPAQENLFNQLQGFRNGNIELRLLPDVNGEYFIHAGIKEHPAFQSKVALFNSMTEVQTVTVEYEFKGETITRVLE